MGKAYGDARVPAVHQDLKNQIRELERFKSGSTNPLVSGTRITDRTSFAVGWIQPGDTLVHKLDLQGRSITDVERTYESFQYRGIQSVYVRNRHLAKQRHLDQSNGHHTGDVWLMFAQNFRNIHAVIS